ncbi:hypothetical protein Cni_G00595 [Canna indica]|uniref:Wound-responsive family protein n=1 Tax=Canna indica TaxID=4628 RepID=A0AAQ3JN22_9LILI|nr:hypothetical protein Cni_G00595 [Canna indica]
MATAASSKSSWLIAASFGAVVALKDQGGACRWNSGFRSLHHYAKANMGAFAQALRRHPLIADGRDAERVKESEESLRKVMYLSCWGPS